MSPFQSLAEFKYLGFGAWLIYNRILNIKQEKSSSKYPHSTQENHWNIKILATFNYPVILMPVFSFWEFFTYLSQTCFSPNSL